MDTPLYLLSGRVLRDIMRYLSYGWKTELIVSIIRRRYHSHLTGHCIDAIREGTPCPAKCREHCWLRLDT